MAISGDDFLGLGSDQFTTAQQLSPGKYVSSENTICRGGIVQTRPGSKSLITLPDGIFQGSTMFKPASGITHLVAAVSGSIYVSPYPFTELRKLDGIQFNVTSQYVAWAVCLKSTSYDTEGQLYFLDNPYSVLMMQDGVTRAAFWDGSIARHLNPGPSPLVNDDDEPITGEGYDETPVGLWMVWANNRLWVSRGNQIFASDIGNPTKFTESQYLNEGRAFYLPEVCTGIAATTDQQGIVCFTEQTGTFLQSSIQNRADWLSTPGFQKDILPSIGCVAPRSIVAQYGMLWWYSARGLINQDDALRANITSRLNVQDNPMFATKANMSFNLSGVCGTSYENMLLESVPYGDKLNTRTMVLDQAPVGDTAQQINAWASSWTGWRPIEWASGVVNGEERIFFGSIDYDGRNRIWEIGTNEKTDNGVAITCNVITREHLFGDRENKILNYVEAEMCNMQGDVSMMTCAAGVRGGWQIIGNKEIVSTFGQIYENQEYGAGAHELYGTSTQTRVVKSMDYVGPNTCNAVCVESDSSSGLIDKGFSVMFMWSGIAGLSAYRIFVRPDTIYYNGMCEGNEVAPRLLNSEGCGALEYFSTTSPFTRYTASATFSQADPVTGIPVSYTAVQTSIISQADADRKAKDAAASYVSTQIGV